MRRITKLDGDDRDQDLHAVIDHPAVSTRRTGEPVILGEVVRAVVLRLQGGLPRISVDPAFREGVEDWTDL